MYKIMIVEDDDKISSMIASRLEQYGYGTIVVRDYSRIIDIFKSEEVDLVLLDINLPKYDGFYWCREIRKISKLPIIFVSARFSDMDQVMAIERGGDDYIVKPFSFDVLLVKIKSLLRRTYGEYRTGDYRELIDLDGFKLDRGQNTIEFQGRSLELTNKEFRLLELLAENINKIVSRESLLEELWDDINFVDDNTLSVNITRLRRQLERLGIRGAIETKRGQGYLLRNNWRDKDEYGGLYQG